MIPRNEAFICRKLILLSLACLVVNTSVLAESSSSSFDVSGYLMLDADAYESVFLENGTESDSSIDVRRARVSVKSKISKNWKAKVQLAFEDGDIELKDAYLQYKGWKGFDVTLGQEKEPFGLENQMSARNLLQIERSLPSNALSLGRSLGVSLAGEQSAINWKLGYYQPDESESSKAITGRATSVLWKQNKNLLHLGLSFSQRDYAGSDFRINQPLEVQFADSLFEGEKLNLDRASFQGAELLWKQGGFTLLGEWMQSDMVDINQTKYTYEGGYISASYLLSGGHRKYKNGELGAPSKKGWEFTSRYSQFNLDQENVQAKLFSVGANYTVNKQFKLMADVTRADYSESLEDSHTGNAVSLRAQYSF
ncbi:OprO/OprP family phosphate-selective porin [Paraglaciecola sp.]|uniref:OprO/OprP family phosphate-selective porin n=1 Tax=Paraglaciecola sp. TaxID=1920173 RepID=UPI003EF48522